ncbi:uncharacterized protein F4812DRAFT_467084 [Daldinia caldariorum]|uniref:uncharacterized protein n=1 Tax=Daldinia caldariorum TaxID=326644 RepID=UPI0020083974|nr:uncharacterized protein F4812DRAFT_467084 [Daldinia caldariorum]KAI1464504.1 hypothetical protein F4812DRAFT_467084 [Daldinia caldariorum]
MGSFTLRAALSTVAVVAAGLAFPAAEAPAPTPAAAPCTTGEPVVTAGYTINYAPAVPTVAFQKGYQPDEAWSNSHVIGTYTFGVPTPVESGFAYAQFKCQYYCNNAGSGAGSFFVNYAGEESNSGSYCTCFDELLEPETFVENEESLVGAWNHICAK